MLDDCVLVARTKKACSSIDFCRILIGKGGGLMGGMPINQKRNIIVEVELEWIYCTNIHIASNIYGMVQVYRPINEGATGVHEVGLEPSFYTFVVSTFTTFLSTHVSLSKW